MTKILEFLPPPVWAQLWQITALILAVAILSRWFARNRPYLAYALWLVVLIKCITPPVFVSPTGFFCWMQPWADSRTGEVAQVETGLLTDADMPESKILSASVHTETASGTELIPPLDLQSASELDDLYAMELTTEQATGHGWFGVLAVVWVAGTLGIIVGAGLWFAVGLRRLRRDGCRIDRRLQQATTSLARRLGLRCRVRLLVTESRVGPAVFGLIRPTVLLPEVIVVGRSADDLEPILAHELIHIRRGDLWVGLLQTVAQAVWWFHPMVWWAGRLAYREAERCCDEAVVAELQCTPGRYARSLLEVLARKQNLNLRPFPVMPGVRPVELTSKRMERIMRLGHGSHRRSPWWCWAVMLIVAALTLPGAARIVTAENEQMQPDDPQAVLKQMEPGSAPVLPASNKPKADTREMAPAQRPPAVRPHATPKAGPEMPRTLQTYAVDDLVKTVCKEFKCNEQQAKSEIQSMVNNVMTGGANKPPKGDGVTWSEGKLLVFATKASHEKVREALKHGLSQVSLAVRFVTVPNDVIEAAGVDWSSYFTEEKRPVNTIKVEPPQPVEDNEPPIFHGRLRTLREKSYPIRIALLDQKGVKDLLTRLDELESKDSRDREGVSGYVRQELGLKKSTKRRNVSIMQIPRITLFNGQQGVIKDCSQSPFVVDLKTVSGPYAVAHQPVIRVLEEGVTLNLSANVLDKKRARIECRAKFSKIGDVDTLTTKSSIGGDPVTVQVPAYETTMIDTAVELGLGKTVLLEGPRQKNAQGRTCTSLVLISVADIVSARRQPLYSVVYNVDDLLELPYAISDTDSSEWAAKQKARTLFAMKELRGHITEKVMPDSWTSGGGLIEIYQQNRSLVIKQTEEVHAEIARYLTKKRAWQEKKESLPQAVSYEVRNVAEMIPKRVDDPAGKELTAKLASKALQKELAEKPARLYFVTYDVENLVVPIPSSVRYLKGPDSSKKTAENQENIKADFDPLIQLITSTIQPESWGEFGGQGTIQPYQKNYTLVIKQSKAVHAEIVNILEQLRRLQDIQVVLDVRKVDMSDKLFQKSGVDLDAKQRFTLLKPREAKLFWALASNSDQSAAVQYPFVTCFNGQQAQFGNPRGEGELTDPWMLTLQGVVSADRRSVRLTSIVSTTLTPNNNSSSWTISVADGQAVLCDATGSVPASRIGPEEGVPMEPNSKQFKAVAPDVKGQKVFLLITPRIVVKEEEEERITPNT